VPTFQKFLRSHAIQRSELIRKTEKLQYFGETY